jgi:hypothetical protein
MKVNIICSECGSDNITFYAPARWDKKTQKMIFNDPYDEVYCEDCEAENPDTIEVELDGNFNEPEKWQCAIIWEINKYSLIHKITYGTKKEMFDYYNKIYDEWKSKSKKLDKGFLRLRNPSGVYDLNKQLAQQNEMWDYYETQKIKNQERFLSTGE